MVSAVANKPRQLVRFIAVGVANTLTDFGLFNLLLLLTGARGSTLILLNAISITLAAAQSFILHRHWTFSSQERSGSLGRFALATSSGIALNSLVVLGVVGLGLPSLWAINGGKLLGAIFSASWNFLWYKYWVFAHREQTLAFPQEGKKGLVSVIIPAYNEELRLPERLAILTEALPTFFPTEIIVVDDGSVDGTGAIAHRWEEACPFVQARGYSENKGKGEAVRVGMHAAQGEYLIFADADATFTPEHIRDVVENLAFGHQVVIGKRNCGQGRLEGESRLRKLLGQAFNFFVQLFFLPGIGDSQCGLKGFSRIAAAKLFSRQKLRGFSFDVELIALAQAQRIEIRELPILAEAAAGSKVCLSSIIKMAWELLWLGVNLLFNRYRLVELRERRREAALVVGLFLVGLAVRLPYLWEVPRYIDELGEVNLAYQIFQGQAWPLHNAAWDIGSLHNYLLAGIFKLFGPSIYWPRLYVAITSALTVVLMYYLGKLLFGKTCGLVAAVLLISCGMHILVTHMAWSNSTTPFFFALALYVTGVAEKKRNSLWLALTGLCWALALQTHSSVLIFVVVVAGYLYKLNLPRRSLLAAGLSFAVGYGNMLYFNLSSKFGSITWLSKKSYTLEPNPGLWAFCRNAGQMLVQFLRTISSTYRELANPWAYLKDPQFTIATIVLILGCYLAKKEGKILPLWLIGGSFAAIPWLNSRYSFYLPTRYIMPAVLVGLLLMAKGIVAGKALLPKSRVAQSSAWVLGLIFLALQLVPHYRYCQSLRGTNQANTMALEVLEGVRRAEGSRGVIFVDRSLPLENSPLPVLFSLQGQPHLVGELPVSNMEGSQLAVLSAQSYARLKGKVPLRIREKFTSRVLSGKNSQRRTVYLVEFTNSAQGMPVGASR